jgi:hypothetical protein
MYRLNSKLLALALLFILSATIQISAQDKIKFGKISEDELKMTQYAKDTSAEAVVLYDLGVLDGSSLQFSRYLRVKILKKSGYERANLIVNVPGKSDVKGMTHNLEGGEVVKTKLTKESIFQEEVVEDLTVLRVFMPNVKVGTVIEIEYSHFGPPFEWKFQDEIPVKYSELYLQSNSYIDFSKNMYGYVAVKQVSPERWVAKDMPAMRPEPFTNSINNYVAKLEMDIRRIEIPGVLYKDYASDWNSIYNTLAESTRFGKELAKGGYLKSEAKRIMEFYQSPEQRIAQAHAFIKEQIKWNGNERLYASNDLNIVYKKDKIGNSADVNLSLIAMLRQMDINAQPVVLSTVDNGVLSFAVPCLSKLNYVVGYVKLGDKEYFLDATEPNLPVGMLPERCLNGNGRLIGPAVNKWIDLTPTERIDKELIQAEYVLQRDGTITGNIDCRRVDYAALSFRDRMKEFTNQDDYLEQIERKYHGLEITDYSIKNKDEILDEPVNEVFSVDVTEMADNLGNTIAFSPLFFNIDQDNPYKSASRMYPVHFKQPVHKTSLVTFTLPEGYTFVDLPEPVNVKLPDNGGSFVYSVSKISENKVQILYKFDIRKVVFLPEDYPILQRLHTIILENMSKQLLIRNRT